MSLLMTNDMVLRIKRLRNSSGTFVNDATITFTVYDSAGVAVSGAEDIAAAYVAGSNGNYEGVIPSTLSLTERADYRIAGSASNYNLAFEIWEQAETRGG